MRRLSALSAVLMISAAACGLGGGGNTRTVLVDFSHDEFASFMIANFPTELAVTPGTSVIFRQTWTGEPHTVTGGTLVDEMMEDAQHWIPFFDGYESMAARGVPVPNPEGGPPQGSWADVLEIIEDSDEEPFRTQFLRAYDALVEQGIPLPPRDEPGDTSAAEVFEIVDVESEKIFEDSGLPWALDEGPDGGFMVTQNSGQPCYLDSGSPPEDADEPCADGRQTQPAFDGTQTYYNSGIIPYEGPQGNTFRVDLAQDIDPGSYFFYCAVHGPAQYTRLEVRPEGSVVPSQDEVSEQARREISEFSEPMEETWESASDGTLEADGENLRGPFGGLSPPVHGAIDEFVPRDLTVDAGEEVTWKLMGADHTISFDVPEYFPIIQFGENGRVSLNPRLQPPAGGAPEIPEQEGEGIMRIDGGTYDGEGFWSSGLIGSEPYLEYTLRFSRPGTYRYACLLHPPMVGTVEVTG